jgi:hypothetical protein
MPSLILVHHCAAVEDLWLCRIDKSVGSRSISVWKAVSIHERLPLPGALAIINTAEPMSIGTRIVSMVSDLRQCGFCAFHRERGRLLAYRLGSWLSHDSQCLGSEPCAASSAKMLVNASRGTAQPFSYVHHSVFRIPLRVCIHPISHDIV